MNILCGVLVEVFILLDRARDGLCENDFGFDIFIHETNKQGGNGAQYFGGIVNVHFCQQFGVFRLTLQTLFAKNTYHLGISLCGSHGKFF